MKEQPLSPDAVVILSAKAGRKLRGRLAEVWPMPSRKWPRLKSWPRKPVASIFDFSWKYRGEVQAATKRYARWLADAIGHRRGGLGYREMQWAKEEAGRFAMEYLQRHVVGGRLFDAALLEHRKSDPPAKAYQVNVPHPAYHWIAKSPAFQKSLDAAMKELSSWLPQMPDRAIAKDRQRTWTDSQERQLRKEVASRLEVDRELMEVAAIHGDRKQATRIKEMPMPSLHNDRYTQAQAARILGVTDRQIRALLKQGKLERHPTASAMVLRDKLIAMAEKKGRL